jgi:aspartyl-tRNA(Asn)/glutamyl-tRNA(Gln) amidotransferase subunit A
MQFLTVKEIRDGVASGKFTATQVVESVLADIKLRDGKYHAFIETFEADALAQAKDIDARRAAGEQLPALAGVPVAIKDNMLYEGHLAAAGARILLEHRAAYSATVVERLLRAGAVIVGRANMDDAAMGSSTETSVHGPTMNPWDVMRIPGGSSGGSAVAVAAGFVPVALGSDTGGSIRQPAAMCGVVGLKPTYGRVSRYGLIAMSSSLDQIGPFAHTVEDAALVMAVIEGQDPHDGTSLELSEAIPAELVSAELKGLRVGVPEEYFIEGLDEEVRAAVLEAIEVYKAQGAEIIPLSLPLSKSALATYYIIQPAEASSNLGRYDGLRYGTRAPGSLEESYLAARNAGFGPEVKRRILLGTFILSAGYYDAYYKKALAVRQAIAQEFAGAFEKVDVILGPTAPGVAWKLGEKMDDPLAMYLADIFTVATNIAGLPGISLPCGFSRDGLPIGLQLQAGPLREAVLYRAAHGYQAVTQFHTKHPDF